jgi:hypothetical protein
VSTPVRNTGAIEFPFVTWGGLYFSTLFFPLFPTMLVAVNVSHLVEVAMLTRAAVDGAQRRAEGPSGVEGMGGKRVSMQRSRTRLIQHGLQIGDVWVRRLSVHRPIWGCWYQNRRGGRLEGDDSWATGVTGHSDLRRSGRIAVRSGAARFNQKKEAWRNSDAASEQ